MASEKYYVKTLCLGEFDFDVKSVKKYNTVEDALLNWFKEEAENPTCTAICASSNETAKELIEYCYEKGEDFILSLCKKYPTAYKANYYWQGILKYHNEEKLVQWEYDQVYPFCFG